MADVTVSEYDEDTGTLRLRMSDGAEYQVVHPHHAKTLYNRVGLGHSLTADQTKWLQKYRTTVRDVNRLDLRARLKTLREELRK